MYLIKHILGKRMLFILSVLLSSTIVQAQDDHSVVHESHQAQNFRVGAVLLHSFIPTGLEHGKKLVAVPSLGLDLEYWVNEKWALGLHNDIELETFSIEGEEGVIIERKFPFFVTLDALWKSKKGLIVLLGGGMEFEKEENHAVVRAGFEYEYEFNHGWDISPTLYYDSRSNAYNTITYGIGIGKRF